MLTTTDVNGHPYNRLLLVITLLIGTFTTFLTQTILTTAYPTLMADFHISASAVQWLTTGFMLIMGIMIPVSAWLLDKFNVKHLYLTAMTIFFLGRCYVGSPMIFKCCCLGDSFRQSALGCRCQLSRPSCSPFST